MRILLKLVFIFLLVSCSEEKTSENSKLEFNCTFKEIENYNSIIKDSINFQSNLIITIKNNLLGKLTPVDFNGNLDIGADKSKIVEERISRRGFSNQEISIHNRMVQIICGIESELMNSDIDSLRRLHLTNKRDDYIDEYKNYILYGTSSRRNINSKVKESNKSNFKSLNNNDKSNNENRWDSASFVEYKITATEELLGGTIYYNGIIKGKLQAVFDRIQLSELNRDDILYLCKNNNKYLPSIRARSLIFTSVSYEKCD